MFRSLAFCLLALAVLPCLVVAQDTGNSEWNTTDLEDTILIGIIAGAVALFLILVIVFIACCCCFCPGMCGGGFGAPQQQYPDPYFDNSPYAGEMPPPQLPLPPPPQAQFQAPLSIGPPPMSFYPEPEPQLPMVMSRPPPPPEPTYNYSYREREPERRERVAYVVRDSRERSDRSERRYDGERRVIIARRGGERDSYRDRNDRNDRDYDDDRRSARIVSSRSHYDSPGRARSDYY